QIDKAKAEQKRFVSNSPGNGAISAYIRGLNPPPLGQTHFARSPMAVQSKSVLTSCPAKGENSFNGPVIPSEVEGSSRGSSKVTLTGSLDGARDDARFSRLPA